MWWISLVPDAWLQYFVHGTVVLGLLLLVIFGIAKKVNMLVGIGGTILGLILFLGGIFFEGGYGVEMLWRAKAKELEDRIAQSEEKASRRTVEIQTRIVTKIQKVHDTSVVIQERIKEVEKIIDADCRVNPEAVKLLNSGAAMEAPK